MQDPKIDQIHTPAFLTGGFAGQGLAKLWSNSNPIHTRIIDFTKFQRTFPANTVSRSHRFKVIGRTDRMCMGELEKA